jgi:hypothetical protein
MAVSAVKLWDIQVGDDDVSRGIPGCVRRGGSQGDTGRDTDSDLRIPTAEVDFGIFYIQEM